MPIMKIDLKKSREIFMVSKKSKAQKWDKTQWDDTTFVKEYPDKKAVRVAEVKDYTDIEEGYTVVCDEYPYEALTQKPHNKSAIEDMRISYGYSKETKFDKKMVAIAILAYEYQGVESGSRFGRKKDAYQYAKQCVKQEP